MDRRNFLRMLAGATVLPKKTFILPPPNGWTLNQGSRVYISEVGRWPIEAANNILRVDDFANVSTILKDWQLELMRQIQAAFDMKMFELKEIERTELNVSTYEWNMKVPGFTHFVVKPLRNQNGQA